MVKVCRAVEDVKNQIAIEMQQKRTHSTPRDSRVVPHPSTKRAHWGLAAQFGTGYGVLPKVWSNAHTKTVRLVDIVHSVGVPTSNLTDSRLKNS